MSGETNRLLEPRQADQRRCPTSASSTSSPRPASRSRSGSSRSRSTPRAARRARCSATRCASSPTAPSRARASRTIDAQPINERAQGRQDRRRRRLPGRRRGRQHHDARAAAAPTPRRSRSRRRSRPTCARSTPTSTASTRPIRTSCRTARKIDAHQLRGDARAGVARRQGAADPLGRVRHEVRRARSTCARASTTTKGRGSFPRRKPWKTVVVAGVTADAGRSEDHLAGHPRQAGHPGAWCSRRSPTPASSST